MIAPGRVSQARELLGWSKSELAGHLDVSPAAVAQWESGVKQPSPDNLAELAVCLGVRVPFLLRPVAQVSSRGPISFRSWKAAATRKANRRAQRFSELVAELYEWLQERVELPKPNLPELCLDEISSDCFDRIAKELRSFWGLGDRPILRLGELLESNGIVVSRISFDDDRFDAFSRVLNGRPYIFLGSDKGDRARSRFDVAHELGHILLHQHLAESHLGEAHKEIESQAHRFASAFLLSEAFGNDVSEVTLNSLLRLKPKWGVSVGAMVRWCLEHQKISQQEYETLNAQIGYRRWRKAKAEPYDELIPRVNNSMGVKAVELLESHGILRRGELQDILDTPLQVMRATFGNELVEQEPVLVNKIITMPKMA